MAFGNISTFYIPINGSAGSSLWGTDVRKLLSSADATSDATTKTDHGTSGSDTRRTLDPYTTSTTDGTEANFGWAITPTDMNSVSGAKRFFPAGNHTVTIRMAHVNAFAISASLTLYVYRVGTAGASRARTLLGSASATVALPALGAEVNGTATVNLAEVIFEADETVQYSAEFVSQGVIITGDVVTHYTGTQSGTAARIATPGLKTLADTTGSATGSGTATGTSGKVLGTAGSATGTGTALGVLGARASTTGTATGVGTASGLMSAVAGTIGTAAGVGSAQAVATGIGSMTGTAAGTGTATGSLGAIGSMAGSATGASSATGILGATGGMVGSAAGSTTVDGQGSSVAGTVGTASGAATVEGLASRVLGTVGTVEIGTPGEGGDTYIRPIFVFDD